MAKDNRSRNEADEKTAAESMPLVGSRSGREVIAAIREEAEALWEKGELQQAGKDLLNGKIGLNAAIDRVVAPSTRILERTVKLQADVAEDEALADRQMAEAIKARRTESKTRPPKRGGSYGSVVHGVVKDDDGQPLAGVVVEARRAGTKLRQALAVDVTDSRGVYQLVLKKEDLGSAKLPRVTLHAGLDRDRPILDSATSIAVKPGAAVEHSMVIPPKTARRVRFALARRAEVDRARLTELTARSAMRNVEGELGARIGEALKSIR